MLAFGDGPIVDIEPLDHSDGDAQFLGDLEVGTCALRPLLSSEVPVLVRASGLMMLLCKDDDGSVLRTMVAMPPHRRKNNPFNVQRAIKKLSRVRPDIAQVFHEMNTGRLR